MNISLPDPMRGWDESRIDKGQYSSASDYVRDLIRKDQERQSKIDALQSAITEGIKSGVAKDFDADRFEQRMLEKYKDA
jgi:antitoxin ParD1/3/4